MSTSTYTTPGWDAIAVHLSKIYGKQEDKHWGTIMRWGDGGPDPLDGISAYKVDDPPHWHFIGFGLSELGEKKSKDKDISGWGFELTLRVKRAKNEKSPPEWPIVFLQKLARYVFNTRNPFDHEHYIRMGGPITHDVDTKLEALIFT